MRYEGALYRPPSEAKSLIIQATVGCSHNKCSFCSMYKNDDFRIKKNHEIIEDIKTARDQYKYIERIFLADGDALIIKTSNLIEILDYISFLIPECKRVGVYASPKSIMTKSLSDLKLLKSKGLDIAYLGLESGSDKVLSDINKGVNSQELIECARRLKGAGIKLSLTLISGIGGRDNWKEHAIESANVVNKINPEYLGLLTLMVEEGTDLKKDIENGDFTRLTPAEITNETILLLKNLNSDNTIFRSNHPSNYVTLKGVLNKDKDRMIDELENPQSYKEEWMRRL